MGCHPILADLAGNAHGILASASDLMLHSVDPASGRVRWRQSLLRCIFQNGRRILADVVAGGGDYESPPVVADGLAIVGGPDRCVHAVDTKTGDLRWRYETSGQVSGCPAVAAGRVYFGQQGGNDRFHCVDLAGGTPIWTAPVGWVWTSATVGDGRVFTGTVEGEIVALSAANGARQWTRKTNGGVYPAPALDEGLVYTGSWDGHYFALGQADGKLQWAYAHPGHDYRRGGGPDSAAAVIWNEALICRTYPQTLSSVDKRSGRLNWSFRDTTRENPKVGMNATPSGAGDRLYVSTTVDHDGMPVGGRLFCLDEKTGDLRWFYRGAGGWTGSSCARDSVICASSTEVFVTCLAHDAGADGLPVVKWRTRVDGIFQETIPAISGDRAYVLCADGFLYAFA